jgi:hypothetical protein
MEGLPGFERLQRALSLAAEAAFKPEGMLAFLERIKPSGGAEPDATKLISAEGCAAEAEAIFRERSEWLGAEN